MAPGKRTEPGASWGLFEGGGEGGRQGGEGLHFKREKRGSGEGGTEGASAWRASTAPVSRSPFREKKWTEHTCRTWKGGNIAEERERRLGVVPASLENRNTTQVPRD